MCHCLAVLYSVYVKDIEINSSDGNMARAEPRQDPQTDIELQQSTNETEL